MDVLVEQNTHCQGDENRLPVLDTKAHEKEDANPSWIETLRDEKVMLEVNKGTWGMPWHLPAMKDVISCDKLR